VLSPTALPWRRPRYELLLLALVAVAALTPAYVTSTQDVTRLCLTDALVHGHLSIEPCAGNTYDRSLFDGRIYSDKAPGMSVFAIPAVEVTRLPLPDQRWTFEGDPHLWAVHVLTSGIAFLLLAFAVGRVAEGISPGFGGAVLATFALGTLVAPLAATMFDHVTAGALAFAAFVLAWSRRYALAGLAAGLAVTTNYTTALIALVIGAYVLLAGAKPLLRYALGSLPPLALLGAYNWGAFGSPFHLSYRYVDNPYAGDQAAGFFGVHLPRLHGISLVLLGDRGLLECSPIVVVAAAGLVFLARRYRAEAIVCGTVFGLMFLVNSGYFAPYGGVSPGPRFLVPGLPFLALGLAPAFARWKWPTAILAGVSIIATTTLTLTWAATEGLNYRQTIWGEIVRFLKNGAQSRLYTELSKNAIVFLGSNRLIAAAVVCACAMGAFALTLRRA
jgi:hypothetical protein